MQTSGDDRRSLGLDRSGNTQVPTWAIERIEGKANVNGDTATVIGCIPVSDQIDLDTPAEDISATLAVDVEEWKAEFALVEEWFRRSATARLPRCETNSPAHAGACTAPWDRRLPGRFKGSRHCRLSHWLIS